MAGEAETISHWNTFISGTNQISAKDFYANVEEAIGKREVPDCEIARVSLSEGGLFSSSRQYLRVVSKNLRFHVCAAPFGNSFFFSWWLTYEMSGFRAFLAALPVIGRFFSGISPTFYQLDAAHMFQSLIHDAVLEVVDGVSKASGRKALGEAERKPIMKEFFA